MSEWILEPHDGEFGISAWVKCDAPTCVYADSTEPGWFAIRAGEWHFYDPHRYQHVHLKCAGKMIRDGIAVIQTDAAVA